MKTGMSKKGEERRNKRKGINMGGKGKENGYWEKNGNEKKGVGVLRSVSVRKLERREQLQERSEKKKKKKKRIGT